MARLDVDDALLKRIEIALPVHFAGDRKDSIRVSQVLNEWLTDRPSERKEPVGPRTNGRSGKKAGA